MSRAQWIELHGAVTHFPIALFILALACDFLAYIWRGEGAKRWLRQVSLFLLAIGVVASAPSILTGYMYGREYRRAPVDYDMHWKMGTAASALALVALVWRAAFRDALKGLSRGGASTLLVLAALAVGYTGYLGGRMVFGSEEPVPAPVPGGRPEAAPAAAPPPGVGAPLPAGAPSAATRLDAAAGSMQKAAARLEGATHQLAQSAARLPLPVPAPVPPPAMVGPRSPGLNPDIAAEKARLESAANRLEAAAQRYEKVAAQLDAISRRLDSGKKAAPAPFPAAGVIKPKTEPGQMGQGPAPAALLAIDAAQVALGKKLTFSDELDCMSCHKIGGKGGRGGPALDGTGTRFPDFEWQLQHLKDPKSRVKDSSMPDYNWEKDPTLKEAEIRAVALYMTTLK